MSFRWQCWWSSWQVGGWPHWVKDFFLPLMVQLPANQSLPTKWNPSGNSQSREGRPPAYRTLGWISQMLTKKGLSGNPQFFWHYILAASIPVHIAGTKRGAIWNPGKVEAPTNVATHSLHWPVSLQLRWKEDFISSKASNLSIASAPGQVNSHFLPWDAFGSIWTDPGLAFLPSRYHSR